MISINWRRGLFRLWIVASVVWLVGGGVAYEGIIRREGAQLVAYVGLTDTDMALFEGFEIMPPDWSILTFVASVILLPPILLFALGWAGLWIVRGFRS